MSDDVLDKPETTFPRAEGRCLDPDCGHWVRIKLPMSIALAGRISMAMPKDSMLVYADAPGLLPGHLNIHVPHDWDPEDPDAEHGLDSGEDEGDDGPGDTGDGAWPAADTAPCLGAGFHRMTQRHPENECPV